MTGKTTVVNIKAGEAFDVFIGRPSKWGNPFIVGVHGESRDGTRKDCIRKYRERLMSKPELLADLHELRGNRLGCYCAPAACHGDVLAELADTFPQ